ncbi:bifunctional diguanylate cyclase/phosphodiesterase [Pseudalkalibacillus berkeleyi]|uniref:EAL domain-containing protein n=1 Tax=Pseudalkalibacillus berkeleyi TaxID=1069813 RepID=A0ABS9GYH8_9BACL|nr:bifunctional diguanylate cyclase/phosphodiesterase [Pseudalkalibacillus berkeleyi]MCF6136553.1 EAL domain-containing protein [Pseudalkalibacillus berkeleyi]
MDAQYHSGLVLLSIAVAVLASYISLEIAARLNNLKGKSRITWLLMGSLSLGGGIWSMHFVAMLAYDMGMSVTYEPVLLTISILFSIFSSGMAFYIIKKSNTHLTQIASSILIGTGIVLMHYIGMEAMQMQAVIQYDNRIVGLSVVIALVASYVAIRLFRKSDKASNRKRWIWLSSIVMGAAISGMHYTGMASATYIHDSSVQMTQDDPTSQVGPTILGYLVAIGILMIIGFTFILIKYKTRIEDSDHRLEVIDRMYQSIIESANDAFITTNHKGVILSWNQAAQNIFGYTSSEIIGKSLHQIVPSDFRKAHEEGMERYNQTKEKRVIGETVELTGLHKSGTVFPIELSLSTIEDGEKTYFTGIIRNITDRVESQERIKKLVYRDELTELPNRRMLKEHLSSYIEQAKLDRQLIAVLFLDLDRFKQINDVYGHSIGDALLKEIASRILGCLSTKDLLARQSGDEFVIVLPQTSQYQAGNIAKKIIETISEPILMEGLELYTSTSIGISLYPEDGESADTLIKHADTAMYEAKKEGGNQYYYFTNEINEIISRKMLLETGLRKALDREEFEVYYQPQVEVKTEKIVGFEALIRWNHPDLGMVSPVDFIPLAEETNLIIPMGEWILREACKEFKEWLVVNSDLRHVSVNISALQFRQPKFSELVSDILRETGLEPHYLELELTESIVQEPARAIPIMSELKSMGVKLSLDDFGTGYSSLSYLKDFPLDTLKIDKSFTKEIHLNMKDKAVVETIVHMANKLGLNVIAEGIETTEQLTSISESNCNEFQGFLCSPPLPYAQISDKFIIPKLLEPRV